MLILKIIHYFIAFIDSLQKTYWYAGFQVREPSISGIAKFNILTTKNKS